MNTTDNISIVSSQSTYYPWDTYAPLTVHIFAVVFIVFTGTIGNGIIIYITIKTQSIKETDIYILALAFIDLAICLIICPQYALFIKYFEMFKNNQPFMMLQLFACLTFSMLTCTGVLSAIALNRVYAVFLPFAYTSSTKRAKLIVAIIFSIGLMIVSDYFIPNLYSRYVFRHALYAIWICIFLIVTSSSYLAIAVRLNRLRHTNKYGISTSGKTPELPSVTGSNVKNRDKKETTVKQKSITKPAQKIHGKMAKMFFVTTVLLLVSYAPLISLFAGVTDIFYVTYLSFINNVANIVVYLCFNSDFRNTVLTLMRKHNICCK